MTADPKEALLSARDRVLAEDFDHPWTAREWNAVHPVGTPVTYEPVLPPVADVVPVHTRTRSEAWDLCGTPVVMVEGRTGGVALAHLVSSVDRQPQTPTESN